MVMKMRKLADRRAQGGGRLQNAYRALRWVGTRPHNPGKWRTIPSHTQHIHIRAGTGLEHRVWGHRRPC